MAVHPTWKKENNSADRLCTMSYDTGSYSAGCKEKIAVSEMN